jgi:hypothetical protein
MKRKAIILGLVLSCIIQDQPIIAPAAIAADSDVELIYSDF